MSRARPTILLMGGTLELGGTKEQFAEVACGIGRSRFERLLRDPQPARSMSRRARRELEQYTWSRVRARWMVAYHGTTTCAELQAS